MAHHSESLDITDVVSIPFECDFYDVRDTDNERYDPDGICYFADEDEAAYYASLKEPFLTDYRRQQDALCSNLSGPPDYYDGIDEEDESDHDPRDVSTDFYDDFDCPADHDFGLVATYAEDFRPAVEQATLAALKGITAEGFADVFSKYVGQTFVQFLNDGVDVAMAAELVSDHIEEMFAALPNAKVSPAVARAVGTCVYLRIKDHVSGWTPV